MEGVTTIDIKNPYDGSLVGRVPRADIADCLAAVDRADTTFASWRATAPRVRAEVLRKAWELMMADHESLARTIVQENGKVLADAKAEVTYAAEFFRWFSEEAVRIDGDYRRAPSGANWLLVSRQPVKEQDHVAALVDGAVAEGATVACGGKRASDKSFGYHPTVLTDVKFGASILQEEIFGPVAPIVRFTDADDILAHCNAVDHGLVSYVFTRDVGRGLKFAEALETGMIGLNRGLVSDPAAPFGGVKASGLGREGGHDGLLAFLETKYVAGNW
ncbi:MAG: aldehyde dehydrogenase family protein [Actinobacteria bacterium]|nr:aldehyde dehydrogenase family protein [Actinomycetota bacterium]